MTKKSKSAWFCKIGCQPVGEKEMSKRKRFISSPQTGYRGQDRVTVWGRCIICGIGMGGGAGGVIPAAAATQSAGQYSNEAAVHLPIPMHPGRLECVAASLRRGPITNEMLFGPQVIQWMQNPTELTSLRDFAEWKEKCDVKGQPYCSLPNACPLTTRELPGETIRLFTCMECPNNYPWILDPTGDGFNSKK